MSISILSAIVLAALGGGGTGDPSATDLYLQNEEAEILWETGGAPEALPGMTLDERVTAPLGDASQDPPPPRPPQPPPPPPQAPPQERVVVKEAPMEAKSPPSPVTLSLNGRLPFAMGSVRFGTFSGGATSQGQRVGYDDLFESMGWGAGAELSFASSDWDPRDVGRADKDDDRNRGPRAVDRHASGFYISGQYDRFRGDTVPVGAGTLKADRMSVESAFVGYKDHEPWGGGFFSEIRVGGGAIHYHAVNATLTTGGTSTSMQLFKGTWGVAAEVAARIGIHVNEGLTIFVGGQARAAEGPREGSGLPFSVSTNTFFTAAAEAGLEFGF
ncbi:MAG TPA: hypothetical protein VM222_07010 [Planctomycetota bacterium]|nr:hypothetical protein [Planctomycetota bacterium]